MLGASGVQVVARLSTPAILARVHNEWRIYVSALAPDRNFNIGHELGHWALDRAGIPRGGDTEQHANYIGAAILASPAATRRVHAQFGESYPDIAKAFDSTQSMAALRVAEVMSIDRALVSTVVRIRSAGFTWPAAGVVRGWATGHTPVGVARVRLAGRYDRGRVVLKVG